MKKTNTALIFIIFVIIVLAISLLSFDKARNEGRTSVVERDFDSMIGLEDLDLYYEAHLVGLDGECFIYSIYLENEISSEKFEEIKKAIEYFSENFDYNGDDYPGYIDVSIREKNIVIFLDLGNVLPQNEDISIQGILKAINNVEGIKKVMINEF